MTDDDIEAKIKAYNAERNAMLMRRDVDHMIAWCQQRCTPIPSTRAACEILMHKSITAITSLQMEMRSESKRWLLARSCTALDDGDVPT